MDYKLAEARARRNRASHSALVVGELTYSCGHVENFRGTAYGYAIVSGMALSADCERCCRDFETWAAGEEILAQALNTRQAEFDAAVTRRDELMRGLGINNIYDPRISAAQNAVFHADAQLGQSKQAAYLLGRYYAA